MELLVKDEEFISQVDGILSVVNLVNVAAGDTCRVLNSITSDAIIDEYIDEAIENKMKKIKSYAEKLVLITEKDKGNLNSFLGTIAALDSKLD